ncbi:MAG: zinc-dependent metalloprotease [Rikenellaceae bacterium]|nr:zinc-dependent metalloprotease [Rikenellaceae bacterium]
MKRFLILLVAVITFFPAHEAEAQLIGRRARLERERQEQEARETAARQAAARPQATAYSRLLGNRAQTTTAASDFISLHKVQSKLYFEIPLQYMDREMLIASTLTEVSNGEFGNIGFKPTTPVHIRFTLQDSIVHMRQINSTATTDFMQEALDKVTVDPILFSFPIQARRPDNQAVVIEVTTLFATNPKMFDFFPETILGARLQAQPVRESSSIDEIKSFEDNLSVKSTLTFRVNASIQTRQLLSDFPVTVKVTRSILLLPEQKMKPRLSDSRVGIFNSTKTRFGSDFDGARSYSVAHRWRLVPSDVEAYRRGELVEPVDKIVFYVEPTFPEEWMPAIFEGIELWNLAFETAGFKNAIEARPFPTREEDPNFDPDNLKYSCVRFMPSATANAMGPSWVDPATGEIVNASVIVWSSLMDLVNRWRFVQTAAADPRVRSRKMPHSIVEESLRNIISHEIGHCLGFMHNMAASAAFPVDSLRSATFTQKYGNTPCIMDYTRYNYVAQPGDVGVRMMPPDIGIYDHFLVKWNYRYLPQYADEWAEKPTVESWVDAHAGDPLYRYGRQQTSSNYDPTAMAEDLGDDPLRAGDYGIKNLKYILAHLGEWIDDDPDFSHRQGLYNEMMAQYTRYVRFVILNIGGIVLTEVKEGTPGERIAPVPRERQRESLRWVMNEYRNMDWVDNTPLRQNFRLGVTGSQVVRGRVVADLRGQIGNVILSSFYSDSPYTVQEFTNDLYNETWRNVLTGRALTDGDRVLQRAMVAMFVEPLEPRAAAAGSGLGYAFAPSVEEIIAYGLDESGIVERYADAYRAYEAEHGRGSVAMLIDADRFGPSGLGFQSRVNVAAIDDSANYLIDLAVRSRNLLRGAVASSSGSARAHYQALLTRLNAALKDRL